jgi:hypothetical protein
VEFNDNSDVLALATLTLRYKKQERECSLLPEIRYKVSPCLGEFKAEFDEVKRREKGGFRIGEEIFYP